LIPFGTPGIASFAFQNLTNSRTQLRWSMPRKAAPPVNALENPILAVLHRFDAVGPLPRAAVSSRFLSEIAVDGMTVAVAKAATPIAKDLLLTCSSLWFPVLASRFDAFACEDRKPFTTSRCEHVAPRGGCVQGFRRIASSLDGRLVDHEAHVSHRRSSVGPFVRYFDHGLRIRPFP
jgi:hypothetical protein